MKNLQLFLLLISLLLILSSCEREEKFKTINTQLSHTFYFDINENGPVTIDLEGIVDASKDANLQPHLNNIIDYIVSKVTLKHSNFKVDVENTSNILLDGIFYDNVPDTTSALYFRFHNTSLKSMINQVNADEEFDIPFEIAELQSISSLLDITNKFNLKFKGTVSDAPLYIEFTFTFYVEAIVYSE